MWAQMYLKKSGKVIANPTYQFKKGDLVRISFTMQAFQRAYQEQFTTEVFKVVGRIFKQGIPMYKRNNLKGELYMVCSTQRNFRRSVKTKTVCGLSSGN